MRARKFVLGASREKLAGCRVVMRRLALAAFWFDRV